LRKKFGSGDVLGHAEVSTAQSCDRFLDTNAESFKKIFSAERDQGGQRRLLRVQRPLQPANHETRVDAQRKTSS
jgi:hypothetical protein